MEEIRTFGACRALIQWSEPVERAVYLPSEQAEARALFVQLPAGTALVTLDRTDWNRDFSPWPAPAVFRDGDFSGGASTFLDALINEVISAAEQLTGIPKQRILAGYSLAGLFALWATMQTDLFIGVASMSGSIWFDGFVDYARAHLPECGAKTVYLSVGDKEHATRNPRMRTVEDATRTLYALLAGNGHTTTFELNPGNHFNDVPTRIAKGILWTMAHLE